MLGTYNFDNGVQITADVHHWETEVDSVSRPKLLYKLWRNWWCCS